MKILHIVRSLDPAMGGLPAVVARLAAGQALLGHDVSIAAYSDPGNNLAVSEFLESIPYMDNIKILDCGKENYLEHITAGGAFYRIKGAAQDHDVVHLHGIWDSILLAAARAAKVRGIPYVVTPHGMLDPWSLGQKSWKKRLALRLRNRSMLTGALFIHVLNEDEQVLATPLGLETAFEVIPNGLFSEELECLPEKGSFVASHEKLRGKPYILFLSRLHYKKGLDILAEAFGYVAQNNADVDLVVAGPDGGALRDFNAEIQSRGLGNRVHVVGPLYGEEKMAAYVDAAVFCLPSRQEGFSMAILEALGCGVPAVVSQQCHFPEVERAGAGRVVALDGRQFGEALVGLLCDRKNSHVAGERARRFVLSRYTCRRIAEQMISAYQCRQPVYRDQEIT